jgi:NADH dehydrogenase
MAAIGQRAGVANVLGIKFSGFIAWWLWRTVYLSKLPGWIEKFVSPCNGPWTFSSRRM